MAQHSVQHLPICLLLVLAVLNHLSGASDFLQGPRSEADENFAALEVELLHADRNVFDHQKIDDLLSQDFSTAADLNVSEACFDNSIQYAINVQLLLSTDDRKISPVPKMWAVKMFDATGKIPTGLLEMNTKWIGSFSECLSIRAEHRTNASFSGQYCTISFEKTAETKGSALAKLLVITGTTAGICWPSSCNEVELEIMINYLNIIPFPVHRVVKPGFCQIDAPATFDATTISVITLFVAFMVLVLTATIYEIYKLRRVRYQKLKNVDDDVDEIIESKQGICHRVLVCFSLHNNGKNISIAEEPSDKALGCIHGIRVFSLLWAILMRTCAYATAMPLKDFKDVIASIKQWSFDIIINATFCMDSMLFASGFCVAYSLLYKLKKSGGNLKIFVHYYIYGLLRLTPLLAMSVAFLAGPWYLLASGPQWPNMKIVQTACRNDWWKTLLYINNLYDTQDLCVEVSWYTSLEIQFYVVAPLIIYPLYRWPIVGYVIGGLFCLAMTITPALLIHYKDLAGFPGTIVQFFPTLHYSENYNIYVYLKPWCRMGPYLVGIGLAYFLYRKDMKVKMNKIILWIGWLSAVTLALALVYGNFGYLALNKLMSNALSSAYGALSRPAWALCIAWIVLVCSTGNGGYSNYFLTWRMFVSVSHLSYSLYIVHLYVMLALIESYEGTMYFQTYMLGLLYVGITFSSIGISSIFYFMFEAPVVQLEKIIAPKDDQNSRRSSKIVNSSPSEAIVNSS